MGAEKSSINQETYMGTIPILKNERIYSFSDITLTATGFGIASWSYVQGAWIASIVNFWTALVICVIPLVMIGLFIMFLVIIPARYGVDLWMYQRAVFGHKFAFLLCFSAIFITWGWYAINCGVMANSVVQIGNIVGADLSRWNIPISMSCAVIGCLIAVQGPQLVKIATWVMIPALVVVSIILLVKVAATTSWAELMSFEPIAGDTYPSTKIAFISATDGMLAFAFGWYPVLGGLSRLAKSEKGSYWGQYIGFILAMCIFIVIGAVCSTLVSARLGTFSSTPGDWLVALSTPFWSVLSNVAIALANIATQMIGCYCLAIALKVFQPNWSYKRIAVGMTVFCCTLIAWEGIWTYYNVFLAVVAISAVPAIGMIFADFFLIRRDKFSLQACFRRGGHEEYSYTGGFNLVALASFVIGAALYLITYNPLTYTINNEFLMKFTPTGLACLGAIVSYCILCNLPGLRAYVVREKRGTLEKRNASAAVTKAAAKAETA